MQCGDTAVWWDGPGMSMSLGTRNHLSKRGRKCASDIIVVPLDKSLPANELESLGMEFEGEINDGGMCLCPYESPLSNDHVNVLIKRYGAGGT